MAVIKGDNDEPPAFDRRAIPRAAAEAHWATPDGHKLRRIDWPGAGGGSRGSLLFLPGRGDFYEKYLETLDRWAGQGWRVTAIDWRGQAGSGRLGRDAVTGHIDDFGIWVDDLAAFWKEWSGEGKGPFVIVGHSMGGHIALRAAIEWKVAPKAIVLSTPMLGFSGIPLPSVLLHGVAGLMSRLGNPGRPAWRWGEKPAAPPAHRIRLLTHDRDRYDDEIWWREARPELSMGPASWGWIERAYVSMRQLAKRRTLESLDIPVLVIGTTADRLVSFRAIERAAARLPRGELLRFGDEARHEILRETDAVRDHALLAIDDFFNRAAPPLRE